MPIVAIIGGGNGAFATAAHLAINGNQVNLCHPHNNGLSLRQLIESGELNYLGVLGDGKVGLNIVTTDIKKAIAGTDIIIVSVTGAGIHNVAQWLAPFLRGDEMILLNPGQTGGALQFRNTLRKAGFIDRVVIGETNTLTYGCRKKDANTINILNIPETIWISALPGVEGRALLEKTSCYYENFRLARSVLGTGLRNLNAITHPPPILLSAAWIESTKGDFYFYHDASTPAVMRLMHAVDEERLAIAEEWDEPLEPLFDLLSSLGSVPDEAKESRSLERLFLENKTIGNIKGPSNLNHRYFEEDFPYGLVPIVAFSMIVEIDTPIIKSMINIANKISSHDFWKSGLTLDQMGLSGMNKEVANNYFLHGY